MAGERIGFLGSGKMAEAIIRSLLSTKKFKAKGIFTSDKNAERLALMKSLKVNASADNVSVVKKSDLVFICVKPQDIDVLLDEISSCSKNKIFISIAAGIKISAIESKLKTKIARVMPNTPLMVGEGMSAIAFSNGFSAKEKESVKSLLSCSGKVVELPEEKFDAVTALSGSGPAFYAFLIDALAKGAVEEGLSESEAYMLAEQTALGTAKLLMEKKISPADLIAMVASKGGTTEKGIEVLNNSVAREILSNTIKAAALRSKQLGESK